MPCLKSAVSIAQQYGDRAGEAVGHRKVELAVAVEVPRDDKTGLVSRAIVDGRLKGAIAVAQKQRNADIRRHRQVGLAIAVEITRSYRIGKRSNNIVDGSLESSIAIAQ